MKKTNLLSILLIIALTSLNVGAQNLLSPITKSHYDSWSKYLDKYYNKSADVNFIMPSDMMISPSILESLVMNRGTIKVTSQQGQEYSVKCSPELYNSLKLLAKHAVMTSSYASRYQGLDGQMYFMFYKSDGAWCWSPYGVCNDVVTVFKEVMNAVRQGNLKQMDRQIVAADSLRRLIKTFYPEKGWPVIVSVSTPWTADNKLAPIKHLSLYSQFCGDWFSNNLDVVFTFDDKDFKEEYRKLYLEKYESTIQKVAHWIYALSDFADDGYYVSFIVDDSVTEPQISKDQKQLEIRLKESDLTAEKMISLLIEIQASEIHLDCGPEFNPEAFRLPEGTTIRDVILKLPGVTIDSLDNIYVNGRLVPTETDILVNGKEFFNEGKRDTMSLEQLTHDMIERVKAYDMRFEQNYTPQDPQVK